MTISETLARQREYYMSGATRPLEFRLDALRRLRGAIESHEELIFDALSSDLNKPPLESYMCETGMVLDELRYHIRHLPSWVKDKRVRTPLGQFHAKSYISPEPYGLALIMSPWNYPVQLCLEPLAGAISGGNCAVIKPSAYAAASSAAIARLIGDTFPPEYISVVEGGREQNGALLEQRFDCIFFTGSAEVGRVVMAAAAKNLIPVTLELGGKSPVVVDESADVALAARRIAFGKVLNAGQTCVEPDYLFIHEAVKARFVEEYARALRGFFPDGDMSDMPTVINDKHFARLEKLLEGPEAALGGGCDAERRFVEPTLLDGVSPDDPIMGEEIFGPILPMLTFTDLAEPIDYIRAHERPLALYLFTSRDETVKRVLGSCSFGGGCVNDTMVHLATPRLPFGGVGASGMGSYHGKKSFDTFTHYRGIVEKSTWIDLPMRYRPYTESKLSIIRRFMR